MARPKIDPSELSGLLLEEAERMLVETQGRRLVLSELAARVGISQPYVHRFFPTKEDLIRELAKKWFESVEKESRKNADLDSSPSERLTKWVLGILAMKRAKYDANPELFLAYLDLAKKHMDLVRAHTSQLSEDLRSILREMVDEKDLEQTLNLIEDATLLFRTPSNIALYRQNATDERALAVVNMIVSELSKR